MTVAVAAPLGVKKTVLVAASQAIAFEVFTARFAAWWPMPSHHIGQAECVDVVVEPYVGGRWFERGSDGSECDWGRVLTWEPPSRVVLAWQLAANWTFDPSLRTEVEVRFVAVDAGHTRVELEHRGLEAYGPEALAMRDAFASASGWAGMLEHYAEVAGR